MQDRSDDKKIRECVKAIQANVDESDPVRSPDPIAFIYVLAEVLRGLVHKDVVQEHKDGIYEVTDELAGIIVEFDGLSWSQSRNQCVGRAYDFIEGLDLQRGHLGSKMRALGRTLPPNDLWLRYQTDFELRPPLHSC